jgi:multidrug efflux system membrane fusion protein
MPPDVLWPLTADAPARYDQETVMAQPAPANRLARWGTPIVAALIVLGGYLWWQGHQAQVERQAKQAQPKPAGIPVAAAKVELGDFPVYLVGLGTVQAFNNVVVRTRVDGQIVKLPVQEGQMVKQGDLIAQIDPRPFQAALDQALAKKAQDEATLKNANLDLQRYRTLAQQSFATQQQLDTQRATVNQTTAQIAADVAAIEGAQTQLGYATITAPLTGRTGLRMVDQGNIVHPTDTTGIISIQQIQPISVVFTAPEDQVQEINKAQAASPLKVIALSTNRAKTLAEGVLAVVNNQVDVASGTIQLKATFENGDNALWPGLSVATRLLIETLKGVALIPEDAVNHGPNGLYVYVVGDDKKAHMQSIKVAETGDGRVVVSQGLSPGQTVVTGGQYRLQDGAEVALNGTAQTASKD